MAPYRLVAAAALALVHARHVAGDYVQNIDYAGGGCTGPTIGFAADKLRCFTYTSTATASIACINATHMRQSVFAGASCAAARLSFEDILPVAPGGPAAPGQTCFPAAGGRSASYECIAAPFTVPAWPPPRPAVLEFPSAAQCALGIAGGFTTYQEVNESTCVSADGYTSFKLRCTAAGAQRATYFGTACAGSPGRTDSFANGCDAADNFLWACPLVPSATPSVTPTISVTPSPGWNDGGGGGMSPEPQPSCSYDCGGPGGGGPGGSAALPPKVIGAIVSACILGAGLVVAAGVLGYLWRRDGRPPWQRVGPVQTQAGLGAPVSVVTHNPLGFKAAPQ